MSCKCNTDIFRILYTFHYPFSPISMGFAPCDARVLAGLTDSTLDLFKRSLFTITKETIFLKKAGSLEGTAFVHSSFQRRNKTLWVLWNFLDTWKLFYLFYLFLPKRKSKIMFSPARLSNLYIYKKAWTWARRVQTLEESKLQCYNLIGMAMNLYYRVKSLLLKRFSAKLKFTQL